MQETLPKIQKITPFLWFDTNAEEAVNFYVSIFPDSRITKMTRFGDTGPGPKGSIFTVAFELYGQEFAGLNGGPMYKFTEAVSFVVNCDNQEEIDRYWEKLSEGGEPGRCGWLKDKFGLSWQVVPGILPDLIQGKDAESAGRAVQAMMRMNKLDIATLQNAYNGVVPA